MYANDGETDNAHRAPNYPPKVAAFK